MLANDVAVGFEFLEVLADSRLRDREGGAEIANSCAAFLLQPIENLPPPRLSQQAVEIGVGRTDETRPRASRQIRGFRHRHFLAQSIHAR